MNWHHLLYYSNGKLYWKVSPANRVKIGDEAGNPNKYGYARFAYKGKYYLAHRVIWEMHYGAIPEGMEVDHIDHDRLNNVISNLRLASSSDNSRNMSLRSTNKSGTSGVSWNAARNKWQARVWANGKRIHLGLFETREEAVAVREAANLKHNYHANHGK